MDLPEPNQVCRQQDHTLRTLGASIDEEHQGRRVDAYLGKYYPFLSRSGWQKRFQLRQVCVNGTQVRASYRLRTGDQIQMYYPRDWEPQVDTQLKVIEESAGVAAVYKPAGLPMHEGGRFFRQHFRKSLKETLGSEWDAVHRLDRETSGLVLCGATHAIRSRLGVEFEQRRVKKTYLCIVKGQVEKESWVVDAPLGDLTTSAIRIKKWVDPEGLPAQTEFRCLERTSEAAVLQAKPLTGRTNQIRIHAAYCGLRLLGDRLYHPNDAVFLHYHERGEDQWLESQVEAERMCLHAYALECYDHVNKRPLAFCSEAPQDFLHVWWQLQNSGL